MVPAGQQLPGRVESPSAHVAIQALLEGVERNPTVHAAMGTSEIRSYPKDTLIDEVVEYINGSQVRAMRTWFDVEIMKSIEVRLRTV
jgi:hypothetical protein